jgi:hypothetical protein
MPQEAELGEVEEDAPVKSPRRAEVGLLDRGRELELRGLQAARQAALLAGAPLALDEQSRSARRS